jgi:hypothetical protein
MSKIKFVLNRKCVSDMLKGNGFGTKAVLEEAANRISSNAGEGYTARIYGDRAVVYCDSEKSENDNYENNTLLKAVR